jgi:hypothetical protein
MEYTPHDKEGKREEPDKGNETHLHIPTACVVANRKCADAQQYTNRSRADCHRRSRRTRKSEASGSCPDTRNRLFVFALQNTAESGHVPAPGMGLVEKKAEGKRLQFEKKNATKNCSLTTGPTRYDVGKHVFITQRKRLVNNPAPTVPFSEDQCWVYLPQLN